MENAFPQNGYVVFCVVHYLRKFAYLRKGSSGLKWPAVGLLLLFPTLYWCV